MFGARLPFRLACLYNIFLVLVNAHYFTFSINPINNYYIYRFNYFAFLIARTLVFRPPSSRSLLGCVLITAFSVTPSCAIVTAVVCSRSAVLCHRCRLFSLGCASVTAVVSALSRLCSVTASANSVALLSRLCKSQSVLLASVCAKA